MIVREYTKEFYKVNIRSGHMEDTLERVVRFINGLIFHIQYELGFFSLIFVEEEYHVALRAGEKLMRKQNQKEKMRDFGGSE